MKTTLSILAFLFASSVALAQTPSKNAHTTKHQKNLVIGNSLTGGAIISNAQISMNVTVPKLTQGATFGEKVNAGHNPLHESKTARPVGPIKGVIVKGGKN